MTSNNKPATNLKKSTEKENISKNAKRLRDEMNISRIKSRRTAVNAIKDVAFDGSLSKSWKTVSKAPELAVSSQTAAGRKKIDNSNLNGYGSWNRERPEIEKTIVTVENYAQLLQERLIKECQSYFNTYRLMLLMSPPLDTDVVATLRKQVENATQVSRY